jgi:hypothetical protein
VKPPSYLFISSPYQLQLHIWSVLEVVSLCSLYIFSVEQSPVLLWLLLCITFVLPDL